MGTVNIHEAKTNFSRLIERVEAGQKILIARAGKPVAMLVPIPAERKKRRLGLCAGQVQVAGDFEDLPPDIAAAFEGESP
ncbi:MAG: type II toxin-antitoxin system Phd/YefM family antitoxin [Deltaproteobacteria bacterium]|nr:type II toxin-antitoxin system Phd/YefM family antitoxin [Deltaproteobacteria bacterium]